MVSKDTVESEIILARFEEICPSMNIENIDDLESEVNVGFKIIGYSPNNLSKSVQSAFEKMNGTGELYRLCYNAWRLDDE